MPEGNAPYNQTGKRYHCTVCGSEFVVTRNSGTQQEPLSCHGKPMEQK